MQVSGRFAVTGDGEASEHRASLATRVARDLRHLDSARILRLVLSTVTTRTTSSAALAASVRSIPLTEVDEQVAERLTVVYSTAAALTARTQDEAIKHCAEVVRQLLPRPVLRGVPRFPTAGVITSLMN